MHDPHPLLMALDPGAHANLMAMVSLFWCDSVLLLAWLEDAAAGWGK
jgi:hypothetical protein